MHDNITAFLFANRADGARVIVEPFTTSDKHFWALLVFRQREAIAASGNTLVDALDKLDAEVADIRHNEIIAAARAQDTAVQ
jgi:hypothetical protein